MDIEDIREYCMQKKGTKEEFPFDEVTLVFKVMEKMYALTGLDRNLALTLKCDPERAIILREENESIIPAFHMNKKHWNTVIVSGVKADLLKELIDHSYDLVVLGMTKKQRKELSEL